MILIAATFAIIFGTVLDVTCTNINAGCEKLNPLIQHTIRKGPTNKQLNDAKAVPVSSTETVMCSNWVNGPKKGC